MDSNQLKRVIDLIRRTGDRCIVVDSESDEVLAIMRLDDYESLLQGTRPIEDLSSQEMLDKVNRDIAYWRSCNNDFFEEVKDTEDWDEDDWEDLMASNADAGDACEDIYNEEITEPEMEAVMSEQVEETPIKIEPSLDKTEESEDLFLLEPVE